MQDIYELDVAHNVNDFLITNQYLANSLETKATLKNSREKLLVGQDEKGLYLSLYLHHSVVNKLKQDNPALQIHSGNLEALCLALEGISHFLYLIWNASFNRSVTMLEMELQAEIDKFVMLTHHLNLQSRRPAPGQLRQLLFESIKFHRDLDGHEMRRYRDANYYADKYCHYLEANYFLQDSKQGLLTELRRFYRMRQEDKLRCIDGYH